MKKLLLILFLFYLPLYSVSQGWKTYGSFDSEEIESMCQTFDGGYIMCGISDSYGSGNLQAYLIKVDINGNQEWFNTYGGLNYTKAYDIKQTSDGGYIVVGETNVNGNTDVVLIKIDGFGLQQWINIFGGSGDQLGKSVQITSNGGFIIAGQNNSSGSIDGYLIKTDSLGTQQWNQTIGDIGTDLFESVQQTADGGFIIVGASNSNLNSFNSYLVKTNAVGNVLWERQHYISGDDFGKDVKETSTGMFVIAGKTNMKAFFLEAGPSGYSYGFNIFQWDSGAESIILTNDNSILICGSAHSPGNGTDIYLIKKSLSGGLIWTKKFGGVLDDWGYSVVETSNSNYVIAGFTESFGLGSTDAYWIKIDSTGLINSTTYSFINSTGCDSLQSVNGSYYYQSGFYIDTVVNLFGTDSVAFQDFTINNSSTYNSSNTVSITACDSFYWDGISYSISGVYTNVFAGISTCDSTVTLDLTIINSSSSVFSVTTCDSYFWDGITYDTTGLYPVVYLKNNGCDSIVTLDLTIVNSSSSVFLVTSCDSYFWDGITYDTTGLYTNVYLKNNGCDSIVILDLTINNSSFSTVTITDCDEFYWDGVVYYLPGIYTNIYTNVNGCDSTVIFDITLNYSSWSTSSITACNSYYWDGITYDSSGFYENVFSDVNGCDSSVTLDLTIFNSSLSTFSITACNSYYWDGITYSSSGIDTNVYLDVNGCDSIVILELTINNSSSSSFSVIACDSFDWDGITYGTTGTFTNIFSDVNGCDSIVTLDLIINNSSSSTITVSVCDSYYWDQDTYYFSGLYTKVYNGLNGCDSIVNLDLIVNNANSSSIWQTGNELFAIQNTNIEADWYNVQTQNNVTRIWLMKENASSFFPRFDCSYFIVVEDDFGCIDTSSVYYYSENAKRIGNINVSPNPTSNLINARFDNPKNQNVKLELINSNGVKIDEFFTTFDNVDIDLSNYPSGTYYLYFNSEDGVQGCRLEEVQKISSKIILNK